VETGERDAVRCLSNEALSHYTLFKNSDVIIWRHHYRTLWMRFVVTMTRMMTWFSFTLLWPLSLYYPIVDNNRTNDWLPCCVAEMDRSWRMVWMGQGNNARTVTRHCVGPTYKATASPSVNCSLNYDGYKTYLQR